MAGQGAAGVRIAPDGQFDALSSVTEMWRKAGELGLVVSSLGDDRLFASSGFKTIVDDCPDTQVVIEHLAGVGISDPPYTDFESALASAERPNTTIKVPGLGEITPRPPILLPEFTFDEIPPLFEIAMDDLDWILGKTAARVWGFDR